MTGFVLNMTGFDLKITELVTDKNMTWVVLDMTGCDDDDDDDDDESNGMAFMTVWTVSCSKIHLTSSDKNAKYKLWKGHNCVDNGQHY